MAVDNSGNIAVLIDGDNVSSKIIVGLMAEVANYGTASVRRIYGDFTSSNMTNWKKCLLNHSITPIQQYAYTVGKNATDGAMIIDAMDLMYTGRFTKFCIVSSDSDFTRLAVRLREQGITVYGFGERKTNSAFTKACTQFVYFDALPMPVDESEDIPMTIESPDMARVEPPPRPLDQAVLDGLRKAIKDSIGDDNEYAYLAQVGIQLGRISPDLNARNYGYQNLRGLVEASGIAELRTNIVEGKPPVFRVRLKEAGRR